MTSAEVDSWISATPDAQQPIFTKLRRLVRSLDSDVVEEIKWGRPCYSTERGLFCYLQSNRNHATLGFQQGASLDDPEKLLEGTGKAMRHIKFKDAAEIDEPAVTALLLQAISR